MKIESLSDLFLFSLLVLYVAAFMHSPHQPVYTATKYGVIGFTRAIAVRHTVKRQHNMFLFKNLFWCPSSSKLSRAVLHVLAGRVLSGRLWGSYQRPVSGLRRHSSAAHSGTWGQHGQVCQVQGWFQTQHEQVWNFTVSVHTLAQTHISYVISFIFIWDQMLIC